MQCMVLLPECVCSVYCVEGMVLLILYCVFCACTVYWVGDTVLCVFCVLCIASIQCMVLLIPYCV